MGAHPRSVGILARAAAVLLTLGLVAAACGDDDDAAESTTTAADGATTTTAAGGNGEPTTTVAGSDMPEDFDPEGIIVSGQTFPEDNEIHFDPAESPFSGDRTRMFLVLGFLLQENAEGTYDPMMAESYEVVDPQTVSITLREGVTFSDGAAYDAEAVRTSLLRTRFEPADEAVEAGRHAGFRFLEDVTVEGPLEVIITLSEPSAGAFIQSLASREGAIVSPLQLEENPEEIDTNPANAGPYNLLELDPSTGEKYRKNPDYHSPEDFPVFGYDVIYSPVGPAGVQALQAGDIDMISVTAENVPTLEADPRFAISSTITDFGYMTLNPCRTKPPFDNLMVRQALQRGFDRDEINTLVYGGNATPAFGLWPQDHAYYNPAVEEYNYYDADEAAQLLEDSGVEDLSFDLAIVGSNEWVRLAEVMQAQLNEVGFDVNIFQPANIIEDFIADERAGVLMVPGSRTGIDKYGRVFIEGSQQALCGSSAPEVMDTVNQTAALSPDDPMTAELYQEAELLIAENAWFDPIVYRPTLTARNTDKIGGEPVYSASRGILIRDSIYPKLQ